MGILPSAQRGSHALVGHGMFIPTPERPIEDVHAQQSKAGLIPARHIKPERPIEDVYAQRRSNLKDCIRGVDARQAAGGRTEPW